MKKLIVTFVGGTLVFFGLILMIIPGPSALLLIPGLAILSVEYPTAKIWLKKAQRLLKRAAVKLDLAFSKNR